MPLTPEQNRAAQAKHRWGLKCDLVELKLAVQELTEIVSALAAYTTSASASPVDRSKEPPTNDR